MRYAEHAPSPALARLVACYWSLEDGGAPHRVLPDGCMDLLFARAIVKIEKLTPILIVDAIEPALPFYAKLGYEKQVEVPHEGALGFVLLAQGDHEVMLQTRPSLAADLPAIAALAHPVVLYAEVQSLDLALEAAVPAKVVVPRRTTFYGMHEAVVMDPAGHVIVFAEKKG